MHSVLCICVVNIDIFPLHVDIDECEEDLDDCDDECYNTDGWFSCDCAEGYELNRVSAECEGMI